METLDLFICHASEDKEAIARPLATRLISAGLRVWYDEFSLVLGDSLRRAIDKGIATSRFGVIVLSPAFFSKRWTQWELSGLAAKEMAGDQNVLLPVWHGVTAKEVRQYSPSLADKFAVSTTLGIDIVAEKILKAVSGPGAALDFPVARTPKAEAIRINTRKERAEYYFYGHSLRVRGNLGAVDSFIRSIDDRHDIFNLTKLREADGYEIEFRTLDCIEPNQLQELADSAGLQVTKNHFWGNI